MVAVIDDAIGMTFSVGELIYKLIKGARDTHRQNITNWEAYNNIVETSRTMIFPTKSRIDALEQLKNYIACTDLNIQWDAILTLTHENGVPNYVVFKRNESETFDAEHTFKNVDQYYYVYEGKLYFFLHAFQKRKSTNDVSVHNEFFNSPITVGFLPFGSNHVTFQARNNNYGNEHQVCPINADIIVPATNPIGKIWLTEFNGELVYCKNFNTPLKIWASLNYVTAVSILPGIEIKYDQLNLENIEKKSIYRVNPGEWECGILSIIMIISKIVTIDVEVFINKFLSKIIETNEKQLKDDFNKEDHPLTVDYIKLLQVINFEQISVMTSNKEFKLKNLKKANKRYESSKYSQIRSIIQQKKDWNFESVAELLKNNLLIIAMNLEPLKDELEKRYAKYQRNHYFILETCTKKYAEIYDINNKKDSKFILKERISFKNMIKSWELACFDTIIIPKQQSYEKIENGITSFLK